VFAATVTGELWSGLGAGPLATAVGVEYRKDDLENLAGDLPFAQRTDFALQYGDSFAGKTTVTEEFVELELPLLRDKPFANLLTINGAARAAQYKNKGGLGTTGEEGKQDITTYKLAAVFEPLEWLRFRGSYSRDIRAAGFRELYYSQSIPAGGFFGVVQNPFIPAPGTPGNPTSVPVADQSVLILSGSPLIAPEKATTTTVGIVLSPGGAVDGMHFSADYYKIKLKGGLALGNAQQAVNDCFAGIQSGCDLLTFGAPAIAGNARSNITAARAVYINSRPYETNGIDFAWDYTMPVSSIFSSAAGSLAFRASASYAKETLVQTTGFDGVTRTYNVAGQTGGDQGFLSDFASAPDWTGTLTVSYLNGPVVLTAQGRFVNSGVLDLQNPKIGPGEPGYNPNLTGSVTDNTVPSQVLLNLTGSYDFKFFGLESTQVYANVNNVFDKESPFSAGAVGGVNGIFFDTLGRTYRVGVRVKF
jgi:outer membrane receptor protein involved in Fe transport